MLSWGGVLGSLGIHMYIYTDSQGSVDASIAMLIKVSIHCSLSLHISRFCYCLMMLPLESIHCLRRRIILLRRDEEGCPEKRSFFTNVFFVLSILIL